MPETNPDQEPRTNGPHPTGDPAMTAGADRPPAPPPAPAVAAPDSLRGTIAPSRTVKKGEPDANGDVVSDVFVGTDQFIIYIASNRAGDRGRLRYVLPDEYEVARDFRRKLTPIIGDLAYIGDVVAGLPDRGFLGLHSQYATLRKRTLDLMARAMQAAFEDQPEAAVALVDRARDEVVSRRDSRNRMRYIFANSLALGVILAVWIGAERFGLRLPEQLAAPLGALPLGGASEAGAAIPSFRPIDVLTIGAIGAFFAVSAAINQVRVNHTISFWEMVYAGFVRVPIGVIAAGVVILLISGGWILASISDEYRLPSIYLFGFLAGFSELFVPNALKQAEGAASVKSPAAK